MIDVNLLVNRYKIFKIKKGNKFRQIEAPNEELKDIQRSYISFFNKFSAFYPGCTARPGMSTIDNAAPHQGANILFKTDIKSFYPSINIGILLRNIDLDDSLEWQAKAKTLILDCIFPVKGQLVLPTGAPTSPVLCNIGATDLDLTLSDIANKYGYLYTRYIDDLSFSSKTGLESLNLGREVIDAIYSYGFKPNRNKTRWIRPNTEDSFMVTGIPILTEKQTNKVLRDIRRICRARLNKIAFSNQVLDNVTKGYLSYIKMIDELTYEYLITYFENRKARHVNTSRECLST